MKILKEFSKVTSSNFHVRKVLKNATWRFWESPVYQIYTINNDVENVLFESASCNKVLKKLDQVYRIETDELIAQWSS